MSYDENRMSDLIDGGLNQKKLEEQEIEKLAQQLQQKEEVVLPTKEEILAEAKKIYEEANNSGDFEAIRQAKTAQLMFICGALIQAKAM